MDTVGHLVGEERVNTPFPIDPRKAFESLRCDRDPEMCLTAFTIAAMSSVLFALVEDFKQGWIEPLLEL